METGYAIYRSLMPGAFILRLMASVLSTGNLMTKALLTLSAFLLIAGATGCSDDVATEGRDGQPDASADTGQTAWRDGPGASGLAHEGKTTGSCSAADVGECNSTDAGWSCDCVNHTAGEQVSGPAESCEEALLDECAATCFGAWGRCVYSQEDFVCSCRYYDAVRVSAGTDCDTAVEMACEPGASTCGGWQGFCDPVSEPKPGLSCKCTDGGGGYMSYNDLGHDNCSVALREACGEAQPPASHQCESSSEHVDKNCELSGKAEEPNTYSFLCNCNVECDDGTAGASTATVAADTCELALDQFCPSPC